MCSNACDAYLEDSSNIQDAETCSSVNENTPCKKCSEKACVVLRKKDPLCRSCFLAYCTHKFRATIGKSHQVKPKQQILLAFSGGSSSTALLHMIQEGLAEEAHKKFLFKPSILFIDERPYPDWNEVETQSFHQNVLKQMLSSGLPCFVTSIGMVFREEGSKDFYSQFKSEDEARSFLQDDEPNRTRWVSCLEGIRGISNRQDFLEHMRWNLIRSVAAAESMDAVFSGECCTLLATQVLSSMATGRGSQVAQNTAFADAQKGVPVLRPLRELQSKEIATYNLLHGLAFSVHPTLTTKLPPCSSLHQVTESFVMELQRDFPATVSTIFRTGDKLCTASSSSQLKCLMCHAALDTDLSDSSAVASLKLSEELSRMHMDDQFFGSCGSSDDCCTSAKKLAYADLSTVLCFGCRNIVQSMKSVSLLPPQILQNARNTEIRQKMHEEIKDFLIEEEDAS